MKTIRKVTIAAVVYVETMPDFKEMAELTVYVSERYRTTIHRCLCGCGEKTVLPLNKEYGWEMTKDEQGRLSFTPSVGNQQLPCGSHYIITKNVANFV